jgi:hypothetical protein
MMNEENEDKELERLLLFFHNYNSISTTLTPPFSSREIKGTTDSLIGSFVDILNSLPIYKRYFTKSSKSVTLEQLKFFCQSEICQDNTVEFDSFENLNLIFRRNYSSKPEPFKNKSLKEIRLSIFKHIIYTIQEIVQGAQLMYEEELAKFLKIILLRLLKQPNWFSCLTDENENSLSLLTCELGDVLWKNLSCPLNEFIWRESNFKIELIHFLSKFLIIRNDQRSDKKLEYYCEICGDNQQNCSGYGQVYNENKKEKEEEEKSRFNFNCKQKYSPLKYIQYLYNQSYLIGRYVDPSEIDLIKPSTLLTKEELDISVHLPDSFGSPHLDIKKLVKVFENGRQEYLHEKEEYIKTVSNLLDSFNFLLPPLNKLIAEVAFF